MPRFLAKIGDYSYSIYLIHFPLFVYIGYSEGLGNPDHLENYSITILYLIILGIGSWIMKKFVEDNKWLRDNYLHLFLITLTFTLSLLLFKNQINNLVRKYFGISHSNHVLRTAKINFSTETNFK